MHDRRSTVALRLSYLTLASVDCWLAGSSGSGARRTRRLTKPLLMPTLAGVTLSGAHAESRRHLRPVLLGQVGGWGGDLALLRSGTRPFLVGVGSFALGHLAYLADLRRHRAPHRATGSPGAKAAVAVWVLGGPVLATLAGRRDRALGLPVLGYSALLTALVGAASELDPALPRAARRLSAGGAWLFLASDAALAVRAFALTDPPPALERFVMATYAVGQLGLAEGAVRARDPRRKTSGVGPSSSVPPHLPPR